MENKGPDPMEPWSIEQYKKLVTLLTETIVYISRKNKRDITGVEVVSWIGDQPEIQLLGPNITRGRTEQPTK